MFTVFVWLVLTITLIAFVSLTAEWLDAALVDTARTAQPFSNRLVAGLALGPFREWPVLIAGIVAATGCLGGTVVAVRLVVRFHARRAVTSR